MIVYGECLWLFEVFYFGFYCFFVDFFGFFDYWWYFVFVNLEVSFELNYYFCFYFGWLLWNYICIGKGSGLCV